MKTPTKTPWRPAPSTLAHMARVKPPRKAHILPRRRTFDNVRLTRFDFCRMALGAYFHAEAQETAQYLDLCGAVVNTETRDMHRRLL